MIKYTFLRVLKFSTAKLNSTVANNHSFLDILIQ